MIYEACGTYLYACARRHTLLWNISLENSVACMSELRATTELPTKKKMNSGKCLRITIKQSANRHPHQDMNPEYLEYDGLG